MTNEDEVPIDGRLFEDALRLGDAKLGSDWIDNVYRASLIGGTTAAIGFVEQVPAARDLWGSGDLARAVELVGLWSAVAAATLLQQEPDQDSVLADVSLGVGDLIFSSEARALHWFLTVWRVEGQLDAAVHERGGVALMQSTFLYWRSLEVLGRDLRLRELPFPAETFHELWSKGQAQGMELNDLPLDIVGPTSCLDLWLLAAQTAKEQFGRLSERN